MSKLLKLKNWLSVQDAAKTLSGLIDEEVEDHDILQLAIDGRLVLSCRIHTSKPASIAKSLPAEERPPEVVLTGPGKFDIRNDPNLPRAVSDAVKSLARDKGDFRRVPHVLAAYIKEKEEEGIHVSIIPQGVSVADGSRVIDFDEQAVTSISGIWDLTMVGAEYLDILHRFEQETSGESVEGVCVDGVILKKPNENLYAQLKDRYDEMPADQEFDEELKKYAKKYSRTPNEADKSTESEELDEASADKPKPREKIPYLSPNNFYPAGGLHSDMPLVVRIEEFNRLLAELSGESRLIEDHYSKKLATLIRVGAAMWRGKDRDGPDTHITNKKVEQALALTPEYRDSEALRKYGARIVRPEWAHTGRPPGKG